MDVSPPLPLTLLPTNIIIVVTTTISTTTAIITIAITLSSSLPHQYCMILVDRCTLHFHLCLAPILL
ncbi:hypothetical protein RJT34_15851 [Clitoria ternatea]|uniref:Uncharacterized protein n=1 Tax=Clitoria ternatea TaxID=43366 RepID=A0AAN9J7D0_CLITE